MAITASELKAGSIFGHYRIEEQLGQGGMGTVYRATHIALDSTVALKVIKPDSAGDDEARHRFLRSDMKLAARLHHPHIVRTTDGGEQDGLLFVVTEFISGFDLQKLIERGPLDPRRAAAIVGQVGSALDEAHRQGMIHRDVKPANVLLETRDDEDWAYLGDFGLARLVDRGAVAMSFHSVTGQSLGTPAYMSPEQFAAVGDIDKRTDVWSLGAVLYAALTGSVPFMADSIWALMNAIVREPFRPPEEIDPPRPLPPALIAVLERALAKEPGDRYQTAGELGRAAVEAAASAPSPAPPEPTQRPTDGAGIQQEMAARAAELLATPVPSPVAPVPPPPPAPEPDSGPSEQEREMAARAAAALLGAPPPQPEPSATSARDIEAEAARRAAAQLAAQLGGGAADTPNTGD
jgi:serine/threonine-protein kinase